MPSRPPALPAQPTPKRRLALALPLLPTGLAVLIGMAAPLLAMPAPAYSAPLPYGEAVAQGRQAATAVLAGAGAETCLRGKITRALLVLADSCTAAAERGPLCALAEQAVVVTPMSLAFMRDTSRQILALSPPAP